MKLKAGLLAEGVYFSKKLLACLIDGKKTMSGTGLFRYHSTLSAPNEIILKLEKGESMRVEVRQVSEEKRTPFKISKKGNKYYLYDKETKITLEIEVPSLPKYMFKKTSNGQIMEKVAKPMGENFLRLYPDMRCDFALENDARCRFCGGVYKKVDLPDKKIFEDIKLTAHEASKDMDVKGFFISTGAYSDKKRNDFYCSLLKLLKTNFPKAQIVFSLSPQIKKNHVKKLFLSGGKNLMLSYNMESFEDKRWDLLSKYCMGTAKVKQGKKFYYDAFRLGRSVAGKGRIKSNFVIGLDSLISLKKGVASLAKEGISSSGTVLYLTPGSIWEKSSSKDYVMKNVGFFKKNKKREFIVNAYLEMARELEKKGLGFPWNFKSRISGLEWDALRYLKLKENSKVFSEKLPRRVIVEVTQNCNLNCEGCFSKSKVVKNKTLSNENIYKIASKCMEEGVPSVSWTGGEPYILKDFLNILERVIEENPFSRTIHTLDTNGTLLTEKLAEQSAKIFKLVRVSLYGSPKSFKKITKVKNSLLYRKSLDSIKFLFKNKVPVQINIPVYSVEDLNYLVSFINKNYSKEPFLEEVVLIPRIESKYCKDKNNSYPGHEEIKKHLPKFNKIIAKKVRVFKWEEGKHFLIKSDGSAYSHPVEGKEEGLLKLGDARSRALGDIFKRFPKNFRKFHKALTPDLSHLK